MAGISKAEREARAAAGAAKAGQVVADVSTVSDEAASYVDAPIGEAAAPVALFAMQRDPEFWPEPHTADVHPDEVASYASGGWQPKA